MEIEVSQAIRRAPDELFAIVADFEKNPRWQSGMESAVFTSEGPLGVGSTYDQVARFMGKEMRTSFRVTEYEEGKSITIESTSGPFPIRVTRTVTAGDGGSVVSAHVFGEPGGFFRIAGPIMRMMVRRSVTQDYAKLKELAEAGEL